jgi:hypothetical protein
MRSSFSSKDIINHMVKNVTTIENRRYLLNTIVNA